HQPSVAGVEVRPNAAAHQLIHTRFGKFHYQVALGKHGKYLSVHVEDGVRAEHPPTFDMPVGSKCRNDGIKDWINLRFFLQFRFSAYRLFLCVLSRSHGSSSLLSVGGWRNDRSAS